MSGERGRVVVGTEDGVWVLGGGPAGWTVRHDQLHGREVWAVTASPHQPEVVFAGTGGHGLFRSVNGGGSWRPMSRGLESAYVRGLAVDPGDPARIYAAAEPVAWYTSTDGGETWSSTADGGAFAGAVTIEAMAVTIHPAPVFLVATPGGLWRSTDAGQTWQPTAVLARVQQLAVSDTPAGLLAATDEGLYRSVDAGSTWSCCLQGPVTAVTAGRNGAWLAAAQTLSDAGAALVFSYDAGVTWSPLTPAPGPVARLAAGDSFILTIDRAGGLWYTGWAVDLPGPAAHWEAVADDLPPAFDVCTITE